MSYRDMKCHIHGIARCRGVNRRHHSDYRSAFLELEIWQQRLLNSVYPIVWTDAIRYKVREEGRYISKAMYTLFVLTIDGEKEILGTYLSDNESASYWLSVLTELQNRGLEDVFIACIDGLSGTWEI